MTAPAILGAGAVRLNVYDPVAQAYTGYGEALGADKFMITGDSDQKQKTSKQRENYGQAIANVVVGKPTKIDITISAMDVDAMALQFQGIRETWTQSGGVLTAEVITAKLDKYVPLSKRNLSGTPAPVVTDSTAATTYVENTDYIVNYANGEIKALASGAIEASESLKVTVTALALTGDQIRGGTRPQARMQVRFEGENQVDGQYIEAECWEAVVTSSNGFDFLADDFNGIELSGYLVVPTGNSEPYQVRLKAAA
jgi:hypothetical protein